MKPTEIRCGATRASAIGAATLVVAVAAALVAVTVLSADPREWREPLIAARTVR